MTIYCENPRAIACDLCIHSRLRLSDTLLQVTLDAEMRQAGWVEYAGRFLVRSKPRDYVAPSIHICPMCVSALAVHGENLRARVLDNIKGSSEFRLGVAGRRFERVRGKCNGRGT